jgi:phosphoglycerate dehydrogenase-like enzyme
LGKPGAMKSKPACSGPANTEEAFMKITVLDKAKGLQDFEFPMPKAKKFGWQEFDQLSPQEIVENCWRTHILITLATELPAEILDKLPMLKLVIEARAGLVDLEAALAHGIAVSRTPNDLSHSHFCQEAVDIIDDFMAGKPRHCVI